MAVVTVRADQVRVGDILSTNGARIGAATLCQTVGRPDEDEVCLVLEFAEEDGLPASQRFEYVEPSRPVHLYRAENAR